MSSHRSSRAPGSRDCSWELLAVSGILYAAPQESCRAAQPSQGHASWSTIEVLSGEVPMSNASRDADRRQVRPISHPESHMTQSIPASALQLRSLVQADGTLRRSLEPTPVPAPGPAAVSIRVQAAPFSPTDVGLLFGPAALSSENVAGSSDRHVV